MPSLIGLTSLGIPRPRARATSRRKTDPLPRFDSTRHLLAANASALHVANLAHLEFGDLDGTAPSLLSDDNSADEPLPWFVALTREAGAHPAMRGEQGGRQVGGPGDPAGCARGDWRDQFRGEASALL
jgi:hypothetical protein